MAEPSVEVFHRKTLSNRMATYIAATRPAFLTASLLPVLVGIAWVWRSQEGHVSLLLSLLTVLAILLIHAGANVINDYFDEKNGSDGQNAGRVFPFTGGSRFIQNGVLSLEETGRFGAKLLAIGALIGFFLVSQGGWLLFLIGLGGGLIAIFYSAPPCLSCRGLGDIAIALDFGILPVAGTVLLLSGAIPAAAWWLGGIIGCYVAAILWVNSIPDIVADQRAGKITLPVRVGPARAAQLLAAFFILGALLILLAPLPGGTYLALLGIVPATLATRNAIQGNLPDAIRLTLMTHALVSVSLIVGMVWL